MEERIIDARGQACPTPLIMTKTALSELAVGGTMSVLVDNETSKQNIESFLNDNAAQCRCIESGGVYTLTIKKEEEELPRMREEPSRERGSGGGHVIVFKNDKMGSGPDELGEILIKAFIGAIKEVSPLPSALVFYTNGIHLTVEGSPVLEPLLELESQGVAILVCGTCLDYFNKKTQLKVGRVSNMFTILETLSAAGNVVEP